MIRNCWSPVCLSTRACWHFLAHVTISARSMPMCELVQCANRAEMATHIFGYEKYYPGGSKGCAYTHKRKELRHTLAPKTRRLYHFLLLAIMIWSPNRPFSDSHNNVKLKRSFLDPWLIGISCNMILLPPHCSESLFASTRYHSSAKITAL